jgi:hypothetical protein
MAKDRNIPTTNLSRHERIDGLEQVAAETQVERWGDLRDAARLYRAESILNGESSAKAKVQISFPESHVRDAFPDWFAESMTISQAMDLSHPVPMTSSTIKHLDNLIARYDQQIRDLTSEDFSKRSYIGDMEKEVEKRRRSEEASEEEQMSRRGFLGTLLKGGAALAVAGYGGKKAYDYVFPTVHGKLDLGSEKMYHEIMSGDENASSSEFTFWKTRQLSNKARKELERRGMDVRKRDSLLGVSYMGQEDAERCVLILLRHEEAQTCRDLDLPFLLPSEHREWLKEGEFTPDRESRIQRRKPSILHGEMAHVVEQVYKTHPGMEARAFRAISEHFGLDALRSATDVSCQMNTDVAKQFQTRLWRERSNADNRVIPRFEYATLYGFDCALSAVIHKVENTTRQNTAQELRRIPEEEMQQRINQTLSNTVSFFNVEENLEKNRSGQRWSWSVPTLTIKDAKREIVVSEQIQKAVLQFAAEKLGHTGLVGYLDEFYQTQGKGDSTYGIYDRFYRAQSQGSQPETSSILEVYKDVYRSHWESLGKKAIQDLEATLPKDRKKPWWENASKKSFPKKTPETSSKGNSSNQSQSPSQSGNSSPLGLYP